MDDFVLSRPPDLPMDTEERCAKRWNMGFPYEADDEEYPVVMKQATNCAIPIGDKIAYVGLPKEKEWLQTYLKSINRVRADEIDTGIYTWILYRKNDKLEFAASRVLSVYEVGTLHRAIAKSVGAKTIHGAGELRKQGNTIEYNFQSGTYMAEWISSKDRTCTLSEMEDYVDAKFKSFFPGHQFVLRPATFINRRVTPPTMEELQLYADAHFVVCLHDKNDTSKCEKVASSCENPLKSRM
jgi:hypothetical protein